MGAEANEIQVLRLRRGHLRISSQHQGPNAISSTGAQVVQSCVDISAA